MMVQAQYCHHIELMENLKRSSLFHVNNMLSGGRAKPITNNLLNLVGVKFFVPPLLEKLLGPLEDY